MPAGLDNPAVGYMAFCTVKFAGYSLAARILSNSYNLVGRSSLMIGGVRTLIGMAVGAAYFGTWYLIANAGGSEAGLIYFAGLLPVRIGEWWLIIWLFYDRERNQRSKDWRAVGLGTLWSYMLDAPALIGFLITGGFSVC